MGLQSDPYLRNSSALSAAEISVTPPLGTYKEVAYKPLGCDKFIRLLHIIGGALKAYFFLNPHVPTVQSIGHSICLLFTRREFPKALTKTI